MPKHSLRRRLLRRLLGPLLLLFAISGAASYGLALHFADGVYDDWLYDSVNSLALQVRRGDHGPRLDLRDEEKRVFEWDVEDQTYFRVIGADGRHITGDEILPASGVESERFHDATLFNAAVGGRAVRVVALPLSAQAVGESVVVEVGETGRKRLALAREILLGTILPQLLLIAVAAAVIGFGITAALEPLQLLATRLDEQDPRRLRPIADAGVPTEITPLTRALNELLRRLEAALAAQRRFVADAAHQLRTPLTALRLHLDQAALEADTSDAGLDLRRTLGQLRVSADRATRLSNQLLALARAEPDAVAVTSFETLDLRALAGETGADWVPRALAKKLELSFEAPEAAPARVSHTLLREALNNLLENAVHYHPGPGRIVLSVQAAPPVVTVADDGPGIPPQHHGDVFKRFHRGDRSGGEGSGLGLAIVQEIMLAHGGRAVLAPGLGGRGVAIRLEFPAPT